MIIRIIKWIIKPVVWHLIFNQISKIKFTLLIQCFITQLLTMSYRYIINVLRDLISDRITNNNFFRILGTTYGLQISLLFDRTSKKFFWLGFVFSLLIYRQYSLFKRLNLS